MRSSAYAATKLRRAREAFLSAGSLAPYVPSDIRESWVRSKAAGLDPNNVWPPYDDSFDNRSKFLRLAEPICNRLAESLAGTRVCIDLADGQARLLRQWVDNRGYRNHLDKLGCVVGSVHAEEAIGTNGMGTALKTGKPLLTSGSEHFGKLFESDACVGVPIWNATAGRIEGLIDLAAPLRDVNDLLVPTALQLAAQIEQALYEGSSTAERTLLAHFLEANSTGLPVAAVSEAFRITSHEADAILGDIPHEELWQAIKEAIGRLGGPSRGVASAVARGNLLDCRAIFSDGELVGSVIQVVSPRTRGATRVEMGPGDGGPPEPAWFRSLTRLERVQVTAVQEALRAAHGSKLKAAALLGVSRSTLYRWITAYSLKGIPGLEAERRAGPDQGPGE